MPRTLSHYQQSIAEDIADEAIDPRHVEGFMRLEHDTLDHLSAAAFKREALTCAACVREAGRDESEELARSFGL